MSDHNTPLTPQCHEWLSELVRLRDELESRATDLNDFELGLPACLRSDQVLTARLYMTRMSILTSYAWAKSSIERMLFTLHSLSKEDVTSIEIAAAEPTPKTRRQIESSIRAWQQKKEG